MRDVVDDIKEAFLTGVSYMLPFVVAGGILVALGFLLGGYDIPNTVEPGRNFASTIFWIGKIGLGTFMVPILGAYVAFSIADKPGICVGMFGGWLATDPWGMNYSGYRMCGHLFIDALCDWRTFRSINRSVDNNVKQPGNRKPGALRNCSGMYARI